MGADIFEIEPVHKYTDADLNCDCRAFNSDFGLKDIYEHKQAVHAARHSDDNTLHNSDLLYATISYYFQKFFTKNSL